MLRSGTPLANASQKKTGKVVTSQQNFSQSIIIISFFLSFWQGPFSHNSLYT